MGEGEREEGRKDRGEGRGGTEGAPRSLRSSPAPCGHEPLQLPAVPPRSSPVRQAALIPALPSPFREAPPKIKERIQPDPSMRWAKGEEGRRRGG